MMGGSTTFMCVLMTGTSTNPTRIKPNATQQQIEQGGQATDYTYTELRRRINSNLICS
ncbi:MAG: hypothetical protein WBL67_13675 [Nitrososphaeraceae archaeon]